MQFNAEKRKPKSEGCKGVKQKRMDQAISRMAGHCSWFMWAFLVTFQAMMLFETLIDLNLLLFLIPASVRDYILPQFLECDKNAITSGSLNSLHQMHLPWYSHYVSCHSSRLSRWSRPLICPHCAESCNPLSATWPSYTRAGFKDRRIENWSFECKHGGWYISYTSAYS
jgi:hypothetical protein